MSSVQEPERADATPPMLSGTSGFLPNLKRNWQGRSTHLTLLSMCRLARLAFIRCYPLLLETQVFACNIQREKGW